MILPRIIHIKSGASFFGLDPRTTFTMACTICLFTFILDGLYIFAIFAILIIIVAIGKLIREWLHALRNVSFLAIFIFAVKFLSVLIGSDFDVVDAGFISLILAFRFLAIIMSFSLFYLSTLPDDFGLALKQSMVPFSICFALTLSMRFFPTLSEEAHIISDAQRSRGLELDKGRILRRIINSTALLIPLIVNSIRRSIEVAEAMECRCYGLRKERTSLYNLRLKSRDFIVIFSSIIISALAVWLVFI